MSHGTIINLTDVFNNLSKQPLIANNHPMETLEDKEEFNRLLLTRYQDGTLKPAPQCGCGHLKGLFRLGEHCEICGDEVTETFASRIESELWLIPLPGVTHFISPISWRILQSGMMEGKFDCLKFLTDSFYKPAMEPRRFPKRLEVVLERGHKRGLNYFIKNFDKVMTDFIEGGGRKKPEKIEHLDEFIKYNRDAIFCKQIPVPSRIMFPIENSGTSSYGDKNMVPIINAVRLIQEAESRQHNLDIRRLEARMVKCIDLFSTFHYEFVKEVFGQKNGALRQHIFGGRLHFTSRAVIVSIYEPHDFREIHFPWVFGIGQYGIQVANKLIKRGYSLFEVYDLLRQGSRTYIKVIADIFEELIEESPYIGLPIVFQRNPTIRRASAILVYVTKIKTDPNDNTIAMSIGNLAGMNADFDGDELNTLSIQDTVTHDNFLPLSPENNVMDLSTPWKISGNLALQPPTVSTAVNWMRVGREAAYGKS